MKNVIIFGVGDMCEIVVNTLDYTKYNVIAFSDNDANKWGKIYYDIKVINPNEIPNFNLDLIIIANKYGSNIKMQLMNLGLKDNNIIDYYENIDMFLDIRVGMLRMCAQEIVMENINGQVAEVGVFKGDFAKHINNFFPNKHLFLFDTFEGFDEKDISDYEKTCLNIKPKEFADTSVELVVNKMHFPKKCIIKKGLFPQTADGIDETFCFVSIDVDLYKPTFDALEFFWPKLVKGGYIFVHDYNSKRFEYCKKACKEFSLRHNVTPLPLCDWGVSTIFVK